MECILRQIDKFKQWEDCGEEKQVFTIQLLSHMTVCMKYEIQKQISDV